MANAAFTKPEKALRVGIPCSANPEKKLEASPGIEPGYADLQSAASPLRHEALAGRQIGAPGAQS